MKNSPLTIFQGSVIFVVMRTMTGSLDDGAKTGDSSPEPEPSFKNPYHLSIFFSYCRRG